MSSMHMNTTIGLRRMSTPAAPTVKRNAASPSRNGKRFGFSTSLLRSLGRAPGQIDGADRGHEQQHRRDLEGQQVVGEELPCHRLNVARVVHRIGRKREGVIRVV